MIVWIRGEGESNIPCEDGTRYCVTKDYYILDCGDISCQKEKGGIDLCLSPVTEDLCKEGLCKSNRDCPSPQNSFLCEKGVCIHRGNPRFTLQWNVMTI